MDYQKIVYFLKAAEKLNFHHAAEELYISPQALTRQIALLEDDLGLKLFKRSTRKVSLTEHGVKLQQLFTPVQQQFELAEKQMKSYKSRQDKKLRIGFFQALPKDDLVVPLANFLSVLDPSVNITMVAGELDDAKDWLQQEKIDLAISNVHQFEQWPDTTFITLKQVPAQIIVSLFHPWVLKDQITARDMSESSMLFLERRHDLEQYSFYRQINCQERHFAPNFDSMLANLEIGTEYAVIPKAFENMQRAKFKYFDLPEEMRFNFSVACIYRNDSKFSKLFRELDKRKDEIGISF